MLKIKDDTIKAIQYLIENSCIGITCDQCPINQKIINQFELCGSILMMQLNTIDLKDAHIKITT